MKGTLLIMTVDDLFVKFVKDHPNLRDYQILVVSRDINTSIQREENTQIIFESKYKNVDFVPSLIPTAQNYEYAYNDDKEEFYQGYDLHLKSDEPFSDICCIVDMVVNDEMDCIIVVSKEDFKCTFPYYLKDFMAEQFGLNAILYEELEENPELDITNVGERDKIKEILDIRKKELSEVDDKDAFINRFTDNMLDKYRTLLLKRDVDELIDIAQNECHIRINKRKHTKEEIVDTILKEKYGDLV